MIVAEDNFWTKIRPTATMKTAMKTEGENLKLFLKFCTILTLWKSGAVKLKLFKIERLKMFVVFHFEMEMQRFTKSDLL